MWYQVRRSVAKSHVIYLVKIKLSNKISTAISNTAMHIRYYDATNCT